MGATDVSPHFCCSLERRVDRFPWLRLGVVALPEQRELRQRKRDQQEHDEERFRFGSQGATSEDPQDRCGIGRYGRTIGAVRASFAKDEQAGRPDTLNTDLRGPLNRSGVIPVTD